MVYDSLSVGHVPALTDPVVNRSPMGHIPASALEIAAVIFAVRFIGGEGLLERASRRGNIGVFHPVLGLRLLLGTGISVIFLTILEAGRKSPLWQNLVLVAMIVGFFMVLPGTIFVDQTSIRESRWFGLRRVEIPWSEVVFAGDDVDNAVTVRSKDDRVIRHTQYHAGRWSFIKELKENCPQCIYNNPDCKPWVPLSAR